MGNNIFGLGMSGMSVAQAGLLTTGHNISNASTPGFSRQEIVQTSNLPQFGGNGFYGQGASVTSVKRLYSDVLTNQLAQAQSHGSEIQAYGAQIDQLSNMLGDTRAGLAPALGDFFAGAADLAAHPESIPSRQSLLTAANVLSERFRALDKQMGEMRTGINTAVTSSIGAINSYAEQLANLNQSIMVSESATALQQANDLRDQRDTVVAALNQEVRTTVVKSSSGSYDIFIGNGQPIVLGSKTFPLTATASLNEPERIAVGYQSGGGSVLLSDNSIQGGTLGGLVSFRSNSLDVAQNALGRIAMGLAQSYNDQHALGQDLYGALGTDFFSFAGPAVLPSTQNSGSATVSAVLQNSDALTTSDYRLQYNGTALGNENFALTRVSDGVTTAVTFPGYPNTFSVDGITLTLTAGAVQSDNWLIEPTRSGAGSIAVSLHDPATIAAAAPMRTAAALANTGNASISAGSVTSVANLPLPAPVQLTFNAVAGQFVVTGAVPAAGPVAYVPDGNISFNGLSFSISGTPANGDIFTIDPNIKGVADNRNALALGGLQVANSLGRDASVAGGQATTSFQGAYSQLVNQVGNTARQMEVTGNAQANMIAQTRQVQQSISGVNLDEEAANLLRYQQAYQASGKMMQIASSLFQTVLELGR